MSSRSSPATTPAATELTGTLERITFRSDTTGFTVARLAADDGSRQPLTVVGVLPGIEAGATVRLTGHWENSPRHGRQFRAESCALTRPTTLTGIERYLGSGLIKGIGPAFAKRIVDRFGLATLEVLAEDPDRLREVPGLGRQRVERLKKAWVEQQAIHRVMVFLQGHEVSANQAVRIYKAYGDRALTIVQENPYRLSEDIRGIGFRHADRIARALGLGADDPRRARAALLHVLEEASGNGHCFLARPELVERSLELVELPAEALAEQLAGLVRDEKIVIDDEAVYPAPLYYAEVGAARGLAGITEGSPPWRCRADRTALARIERRLRITLAPEQQQAIETALSHRLTVITGGPGTGKSTILRTLLNLLAPEEITVRLAAPTGRAAKRLAEATDSEAATLHRLLAYDPQLRAFRHHDANPLDADLVVVDEASMMDIAMANALCRAIPPHGALLLVGDADQLPSVGPGNVLRDVIDAGACPVVRLTHIFRQGPGSLISLNAARINAGQPLDLAPDFAGEKDFYLIERATPEAIEEELLSLCTGRLTKRYGFDPRRDIQVLTPMHRGVIGTEQLNRRIRESLGPEGPPLQHAGRSFSIGDKVMQTRNNYDKEAFNGDLGFVSRCRPEDQALTVLFEGRPVLYEGTDLQELDPAFAITVHKSQGSEFPCVLLPLHTCHYPMLQRNLLYTAITRGKRLVVVIGSRKALGLAIRNNRVATRHTKLNRRLAAW